MKAVEITGYEKAIYTDVSIPEPAADELLVRVRRVGVCHSDVEVYRQELGVYRSGTFSLPIIPGHEWAGEIVDVGSAVSGFHIGENVTGECGIGCGKCDLCDQGLNNICPGRVEVGVFGRNGAYAQYLVMPYQHAHHLYDLSYRQGSLIEPLTVGMWICRRAGIEPGDRVAVIGTGTVGLVTTHMARYSNADQVVAFGRKPAKLQMAQAMGADQVVNLTEVPLEQAIRNASSGKGFNVVIEAAGTPAGLTMSLRAAAPRARVIVTGVFEGEEQTIDLNTIMPKELTVIGSLGGPTVFDEAIQLVRDAKVDVTRLNTHTLPLSEGPQALAMVAEGRPDLVKIHLEPPLD